VTNKQRKILDAEVERRLEEADLKPGMTFDEARERRAKAGFHEHAAASWAAFHVEVYPVAEPAVV
jgi:hypothetical protein